VGPFTVAEVIGEGGMGTVLRCSRKGEDVAVKMIRPNLLGSDDIRGRFAREAELLQSVNHPNVARIVGYDASNKTAPWLATEFIDGPNLREWVAENGPMEEEPWENLARGVLEGLVAIHATGILHRDIKPANIMLSPEGPKIIDFGISKEEGHTALTNTQMFAGTLAYLAPERVERNEESQASDMFSAGLVLAVAAKGQHPWGDETTQTELSILMNMSTDEPQLDGLSKKQVALLRPLLQRQPHLRPTASDAIRVLSGELTTFDIPKKSVLPDRRKKETKRKQISGHFTPGLPRALARGFAVTALAFVVTVLTGLLVGTKAGFSRLQEAVGWAALEMSNALRLQPAPTELDWVLSPSDNITTTLALRPSLLTFGLAVALFYFGRKYAPAMGAMSLRNGLTHLAALVGPLVLVTVGLSWLIVDVGGMMPWDGLFAAVLLVLATGLGMVSGGFAHEDSYARWWLQAARTFTVIAGGLAVAVLLGGVVHGILTPDIATSTIGTGPGPLYGPEVVDFIALITLGLLFLPAIIFLTIDALLSGQGYAAFRANELIYLQLLSEPTDSSAWFSLTPKSLILWGLFLGALMLIGLIAGTRTAVTRDKYHAEAKSFVSLALLSLVFGLSLFAVLRVAVDSTPDLRGSLLLHGSLPHTLITMGLVTGGLLVITVATWVGGHHKVAPKISPFIPGLTAVSTKEIVPVTQRKRFSLPRTVGVAIVSMVAIITLIVPPGIGLVERTWATTLTPEAAVSELALAVEIKDGEQLTKLLPRAATTQWLPEKALERAQPMVGQQRKITVSNDFRVAWSPGELDATAVITWPSETGTIKWTVPMSSQVSERFIFMRQANFSPEPEPLVLQLSADSRLGNIPGAPISVNGEPVSPGSYSLIPGVYSVEREGIELIAPFSETFQVAAPEHAVYVPVELNLPSGADAQLTGAARDAAEACGDVRRSPCFSTDDVYRVQKVSSGRTPGKYYAKESTSLEAAGLKCEAGEDTLLSTSKIVRTVECVQGVTYETKYWDSRQIAEPVYSRRCANWWYSWWFGLTCLRWETYQSGTNYRTVRGNLIDTVRFRSDMPIRVSVPAGLDESGTFIISEPALN